MGFGSGPSLGAVLLGEGTPGHVVERARAAERGGLDSLWFIEDYFQTGAFAVAGAAAAVTTRLGIGLGVVNPYTRHPALLAMETATLAGIAPGRVVLGLGAGVRRWSQGQMAIPAPRPLAPPPEGVDLLAPLSGRARAGRRGGGAAGRRRGARGRRVGGALRDRRARRRPRARGHAGPGAGAALRVARRGARHPDRPARRGGGPGGAAGRHRRRAGA